MKLTWHLGDVVRKLRRERGWTSQQDFASQAGIDLATIASLEQHGAGASTQETIRKIAAALDLTERDLYGYVPVTPTAVDHALASSSAVLRFDRTVRSVTLIVRAVIDPDTLVIEDMRVAHDTLLTLKGDHRGKHIEEVLPATFIANVTDHVGRTRTGESVTMLYSLRRSGVVVFRQATFEPYRKRALITVSAIPPPSELDDLDECCGEYKDCADCVRQRQASGSA